WRTGWHHNQMNFAFAQCPAFVARRHLADGHAGRVFERIANTVRSVAGFNADDRRFAAAAGKRNSERHRDQNRKDERPADRLGFARKLAQPCEGELDERMPRSATVNRRLHSSRRCLPVSATNTSSSVPWCVTTRGAPSVAISSRGEPSAITLP